MKRSLVTGGAGFIGGHLARQLVARGKPVTILDDFSSGTRDNLAAGARVLEGSVTDPAIVRDAMQDCDEVFHFAALVSVPACIDNWSYGHQVNIGGSINVFEVAKILGGIPVIYASSAAIYGDRGARLCVEDSLPCPKSPYGADKLASEHHARAFWETAALPSMGLRFFNVYGPGQSHTSPYSGVIARFCDNAKNGRAHTVFGDGEQVRDFVFIDDLVLLLGQLMAGLKTRPRADIANVCTNQPTSLRDLIRLIDGLVPASGNGVVYRDGRRGDIRYSLGDNTHLKSLVGDISWTQMSDGLAKTLKGS
ncbi:NAD-dependent epimerase/dehydratase family protein [Yoonia sp. SS1-5]|uniref:NAD-dependent epimerase/dehydratase family protein n=1 Tax=Yoonia rhodophyticola TaxID=3137370 RepID=A0AAN0MBJ5_9RHOB